MPDELASPVLRVPAPMRMTAVYLVRDGFVLELMQFAAPGAQANGTSGDERARAHAHLDRVADFEGVLARVADYGGEVLLDTKNDMVAFVRDPDGQLIELGTMGWRDMLPPLPSPHPQETS